MVYPLNFIPTLIPPRSRLYHLEPVGVGTPFVESLSSYFSRLAQAHYVTNYKLYKYEVAPLLQEIRTDGQRESPHYSKLLERSIGPINGALDITKAWVEVLEALTKRTGLRLLTGLQMGTAVSPDDLMRKATAWCPSCYGEWSRRDKIIYQPLLWMFSAVEICPRHKQHLEQVCPHCSRKQIFFNSRTLLGHCSRCYGSLCDRRINASLRFTPVSRREYNQQLWRAEVMTKWIEAAQSLTSVPNKEEVVARISRLIDVHTGGNCSAFSRLSGITATPIFGWLTRGTHIKLSSLLDVLFPLHIDLTNFLLNADWQKY